MKKKLSFLIILLIICSILIQVKAQGISTLLESTLLNSTSSVESEIPAFNEIQQKEKGYPWLMFRHDPQHTGYTEGPGPDKGELIWRYKTNNWIVSSPCVADGRVYVGSIPNYSIQINQTIGFGTPIFYCLDADTGNLLWEAEIDFMLSSPAVIGDKVYVGSFNGSVYCLDANTGTIKWRYVTADEVSSSPTVVGDKIYVASDDGYIYCLNADFGSLVWKFWIGDSSCRTPTVIDGKVFIGDEANDIYCLDAYTGSIVWKSHVFSFSGFYSTPAVIDGKVYIASSVGICCLDANAGDHIWDYRTENWSSSSSPAVAYGNVYIGSENRALPYPRAGCIYCLDGDTGDLKWIYEVGGAVTSSPAVASGMVYVGSIDNYVYCLDAYTGNLVWKYETGDGVESSPAVAYGKVYVGSKDGYIYCLGTKKQVTPKFTCNIHSIFDDYSDLRLVLEYIFQKGVPFGKIVDCVITITIEDPTQVRSVSVIINGEIYNAEQVSLGVYRVFYYLTRNDAAKIIWTIISAIIKLPLPGIAVTVPTPILKQIIVEDINFQRYYHSIDKKLPTIEDSISRLWYLQPPGQFILAASPVDILVVDSKGRRVGAVYENGIFVKEVTEISGAYYSGRDVAPEFVFVPTTEDVNVLFHGVSKEEYELFVIKEDKGSITFSKSTGKVSILQGEAHEYTVTSTEVKLSKKQVLTPTAPYKPLPYGLIAVVIGIAVAGIAIAIAITKRRKL